MTTWFHRLRRMRQKLAAMTELNQALCEANIKLTEDLQKSILDAANYRRRIELIEFQYRLVQAELKSLKQK